MSKEGLAESRERFNGTIAPRLAAIASWKGGTADRECRGRHRRALTWDFVRFPRAGVPHTTARDWRRRHRARAPALAVGLAGLAAALGGPVEEWIDIPVPAIVSEETFELAVLLAQGITQRRHRGLIAGAPDLEPHLADVVPR